MNIVADDFSTFFENIDNLPSVEENDNVLDNIETQKISIPSENRQNKEVEKAPHLLVSKTLSPTEISKLPAFEKWAIEIFPELKSVELIVLQQKIQTHRYAKTLIQAKEFINSGYNTSEQISAFLKLKKEDADLLPGFFQLLRSDSAAAKTLLVQGTKPQFKNILREILTTSRLLEGSFNVFKAGNSTERFFELAIKNHKMLDLIPYFGQLSLFQYLGCLKLLEGNNSLIEPLHIYLFNLMGANEELDQFFTFHQRDPQKAEKLLLIAHRYPDLVQENTTGQQLVEWYDKYKSHPQFNKILPQLIAITANSESGLCIPFTSLFYMRDKIPEGVAVNLLGLAAAGYTEIVKSLHAKLAAEQGKELQYYQKVAEMANSSNPEFIGKLLSLTHPSDLLQQRLKDLVRQTTPSELGTLTNIIRGYADSTNHSLIHLYLDWRSLGDALTADQKFMMECASKGSFSLMRNILEISKQPLNPYWNLIKQKAFSSVAFAEPLVNLYLAIKDQPKPIVEEMLKFASRLREISGEVNALNQLGLILHLLEVNPTVVKSKFLKPIKRESQMLVWLEHQGTAEIRRSLEHSLGDHQKTSLSVEISKLIVQRSGKANRWLVPSILNAIAGINHGTYKHVQNILNQLQKFPFPAEQLESVTAPLASAQYSPMAQAIQKTFNVVGSISDSLARRAALSACLFPIQQKDAVGSCFATSVTMQKQENLSLALKDLAELIRKGCLTRVENGIARDYITRKTQFGGDNEIARVWEYTLASMSEADWKGYSIRSLSFELNNHIANQEIRNLIPGFLSRYMARARFVYDSETYSEEQGYYGGWKLYDTQNHVLPNQWLCIKNKEEYRQFLTSAFNEYINSVMPSPNFAERNRSNQFVAVLHSNAFLQHLIMDFNNIDYNESHSMESCLQMEKMPWTFSVGGLDDVVLKTSTQSPILIHHINGDTEEMRVKEFLAVLESLPEGVLAQNSLVISSNSHAFRFFPSCLKDLRELVNKLEKRTMSVVTEKLKKSLIQMFSNQCPGIEILDSPQTIAKAIVNDAALQEGSLTGPLVEKARIDLNAFQEVGVVSPFLINFGDNNYTSYSGLAWRHNLFTNTVDIRCHEINSARPDNLSIDGYMGVPFHLNIGPYILV